MSKLSQLIVFKNSLGSYTAAVIPNHLIDKIMRKVEMETDHFTPEKAVGAVADKAFGMGLYERER